MKSSEKRKKSIYIALMGGIATIFMFAIMFGFNKQKNADKKPKTEQKTLVKPEAKVKSE
jgi:hypothetical protein